ncbi:hypothetical protein Phum_PHUM092130 [Pediculus humanus corporis]|uniref:Uncharacterized protein n=1 Tax=Pediculus humanus subsp. corporis TaxID=121224 RepID=E0VCP8_PEDHC|nr:uncharacterized protein Phum_PHUM092130 [Pediculus humanus corporis]EEB11154.1 hypothetical protein Phum_PHUM092130 [Pediculus humanus corporis]
MISEDDIKKRQCYQDLVLPREVRIKYFPINSEKFSYDVLPLFGRKEHENRIMNQVSILKNEKYAEKWKKFLEGMPASLSEIKPTSRQNVSENYYETYVGPPSPDAIFHRSK